MRIDWNSKLPTIMELKGKKTGPEIAAKLGVSIHSLRWFCARKGISLVLKGRAPKLGVKTRSVVKRVQPPADPLASFGKMTTDIEKLWKSISANKNNGYVSSYTINVN